MDRFPVGTTVSLEIPYVDYNGNAVVPTAVTYTVTDENDAVITGPTAVPGPYTAAATIVVDGSFNTPAGARSVELEMTSAVGVSYVSANYQCRDDNARLVVMTNSFQTLLQAQLTANDMVNISGWNAASNDQLIGALEESYYRLTRFAYLIRWPQSVDTQNVYLQDVHARITPSMWPLMTQALFSRYPTPFQIALKKAQITEANAILSGDPIGDKIRSGIQSEAVGESKVTFQAGVKALDMGLNRATMEHLKTYLDYRLSLTRAI